MPTNCDNEWFVGQFPVSKAYWGETQVYPCADDPGGGGDGGQIGKLHYYICSPYGPKIGMLIPGTSNGVPAYTRDTNKIWLADDNGYPTGEEIDKLGAWVSTDDVRMRVTDQTPFWDMLVNLPQTPAEPTTYNGQYPIDGWDFGGLALQVDNLGTPTFTDARICYPGNVHYPSGYVYEFHGTGQYAGGYDGQKFIYENGQPPWNSRFSPGLLAFHLVSNEPLDWLPQSFEAGRSVMEQQVRDGLLEKEDYEYVMRRRSNG